MPNRFLTRSSINRNHLQRAAGIAVLPLLWFLAADLTTLASPILLPPLHDVTLRLCILLQKATFWYDFTATILRWLVGLTLGVGAGVPIGLALGASAGFERFASFPLEFLRSLPVTAIFPLFLIVFGIGDGSKVAMAFTPTFLLMVINTLYGVRHIDPTRRRMAAVFGATRGQIFRRIIARDALPQIMVGLRLSVAQSLIVTVVSEMFIGTDYGLGQRIYDSYLTNSVTTLYALLIVLGTIGYLANRLMMMCERRFLYWTGK